MDAKKLLETAIIPGVNELSELGVSDNKFVRQFLLAIALQESGLSARRQMNNGPAVSYWQFEQMGGCKGVLTHPSSSEKMRKICAFYDIEATPQGLWEAMRYQDIVAAIAARLMIYTLPQSIPITAEDGWIQYASAWRPGKPRPETWRKNWDSAGLVVN